MSRNEIKKIYKQKCRQDGREVGRRINVLNQEILYWRSKPQSEVNIDAVTLCLRELSALHDESRFRDDFPTFASFKSFIKKENISVKELEEIYDGTNA